MSVDYPGTTQHKALLGQIVSYYQNDRRILAVCLFGSLARGNWDQYSDLDLDVVIEDQIQINVMAELQSLCTAFQTLGEYPLIIVPDGDDAGNVVLTSLAELRGFVKDSGRFFRFIRMSVVDHRHEDSAQ